MSNCSSSSMWFPASSFTSSSLTQPGPLLVQSLPTLSVALVWLLFESLPRRRVPARRMWQFALFVGLASLVAQSILAWRVFDLMQCDEDEEWARLLRPWQFVVATLVSGASNLVLLLCLGPRFPRAGILVGLTWSIALVVADWSLRGGFTDAGRTAQPLVAMQQCACILVITLLYNLPAKNATRAHFTTNKRHTSTKTPPMVVVDSLAHRQQQQQQQQQQQKESDEAVYKFWSWFT